ncbi:hypothetical protein AB1Y20_003129 [Prymnesium parvum]|uniref:Uncharacterized protein n=1 Tax=Prymnesium parvum TaxID=97485 RepID=A0AB34JCE3_PRYPA|mmetsp:Transcript_12793/g.19215  ORF Transcript_12793/g.19215 Transcript_12793/m.19215 type:complete len:124 (-) Transcript_12793:69-440(-)
MAPWDLRETLKSCNGGTLPDQLSVEQFHRAWDQVLRGDHGVASWVQPHRSAYRVRVRNVILPDGEAAPKGSLSLGVHSTTEAAHADSASRRSQAGLNRFLREQGSLCSGKRRNQSFVDGGVEW